MHKTSLQATAHFAITLLAISLLLAGCTPKKDDTVGPTLPPRITGLSPSPAVAGALLTINGTNLGDATGQIRWRVGASTFDFPVVNWSATRVIAAPPAGAAIQPFYARSGVLFALLTTQPVLQDSTPLVLNPPANFPLITAISTTSGTTGTAITLTGVNFAAGNNFALQPTTGGSNPISQPAVINSATQAVVTLTTAATVGSYNFTVAGSGGSPIAFNQAFTVNADGPAPTITPAQTSAQAGTAFVLDGTNLNTNGSTQVFLVQGAAQTALNVLAASGTQVLLGIPQSVASGAYTFLVRSGNRFTSFTNTFNVNTTTPAITSLLPNPINTGSQLVVGGSGFNINTAGIIITVRQFMGANSIVASGSATAGTSPGLVQFQLPAASSLPAGSYWVGITHNGNTTFSSTQLVVQ